MRIKTQDLFSDKTSPYVKSLVMKRRAGIQLTEKEQERFNRESHKLNEVVSITQPTKYHDRVSPSSRILQTFHKQNDSIEDMDDEDELDLQELIDELESEMEDDIDLEEILEEMGYYDDEDEVNEKTNFSSKGYKEARKIIDKLRRDVFRNLSDDELDEFMKELKFSFGLR